MKQLASLADAATHARVALPENAFFETEALLGLQLNSMAIGFGTAIYLSPHYANDVTTLPPFDLRLSSEDAPQHTRWNSFVRRLFDRIPSFDKTRIARLVVIPLKLDQHANSLVVDREHRVAVVCEPHGLARGTAIEAVAKLLPTEYRVVSSIVTASARYQSRLPYCATWAPFLAAEIVKVAFEDEVSAEDAALGLEAVLVQECMEYKQTTEQGRRRWRHRMDGIARLLAATAASLYLHEFSPGGTHIHSILGEVIPDILTKQPLKLLQAWDMQIDIHKLDADRLWPAMLEWYALMQGRNRCASWRYDKATAMFNLVAGFKPIVMSQVSKGSRPHVQALMDASSKHRWQLRAYAHEDDVATLLNLDRRLPKIPKSHRNRAYWPSVATQKAVDLLGLQPHSIAHKYVFGYGAEMALKRTKRFQQLRQDVLHTPLEDVARGLARANGTFGHLWLSGTVTGLFEETWDAHVRAGRLPAFQTFLEGSRAVDYLSKHENSLRDFLAEMEREQSTGVADSGAAGGGGGRELGDDGGESAASVADEDSTQSTSVPDN